MRVLALEAKLENKAVIYAEKQYGMLALKFTPAGQAGWADRLFITRAGVHFYIEFKRKNEKLRALQEHRRWQLQQHNCSIYGPVDDWEHTQEIIDYYGNLPIPEADVGTP
jgi:hypothetical protein